MDGREQKSHSAGAVLLCDSTWNERRGVRIEAEARHSPSNARNCNFHGDGTNRICGNPSRSRRLARRRRIEPVEEGVGVLRPPETQRRWLESFTDGVQTARFSKTELSVHCAPPSALPRSLAKIPAKAAAESGIRAKATGAAWKWDFSSRGLQGIYWRNKTFLCRRVRRSCPPSRRRVSWTPGCGRGSQKVLAFPG